MGSVYVFDTVLLLTVQYFLVRILRILRIFSWIPKQSKKVSIVFVLSVVSKFMYIILNIYLCYAYVFVYMK